MSEGKFDQLAYLELERQRSIDSSSDLLWENLESGRFNFELKWEQPENVPSKKNLVQHQIFFPLTVEYRTSLTGSIAHIGDKNVREILTYGASRRAFSISDAVSRFSKIAYPGRSVVLTSEEKRELDDALLLIYVHIVGVFDALAIALKLCFFPEAKIPKNSIDLLASKFRKLLGISALDQIMLTDGEWFRRVKEELRNRYVHRIPPYVAPSQMTYAEADEFRRLELEIWERIKNHKFDQLDELREKQASFGTFHPYFTFIEDNKHMVLNPTVIDDVMRFQKISLQILNIILAKPGLFSQP